LTNSPSPVKILVVCGTYPPDIGGSELSIHTICCELLKRGHFVTVISDDRRPSRYNIDDIEVLGVPPEKVVDTLDRLHQTRHFDTVITQLIYSPETMIWSKKKNVPCIYFLRNNEMNIDISLDSPFSPEVVIANSNYVAQQSRIRWPREIEVLYPCVDFTKLTLQKHVPFYITAINPLVIKGGKLVYSIANAMPGRKFQVVWGWSGLRNKEDFHWSTRQWELIARAHGKPKVNPPEEVDFSDLDNVIEYQGVQDMRPIYGRTRIILFPSLWNEAFGRVVLESLHLGIPVITTAQGGILETGISKGGILIDKESPMDNWLQAIRELDDEQHYRDKSKGGKLDTSWYSLSVQMDKFEEIIQRVTRLKNVSATTSFSA